MTHHLSDQVVVMKRTETRVDVGYILGASHGQSMTMEIS